MGCVRATWSYHDHMEQTTGEVSKNRRPRVRYAVARYLANIGVDSLYYSSLVEHLRLHGYRGWATRIRLPWILTRMEDHGIIFWFENRVDIIRRHELTRLLESMKR